MRFAFCLEFGRGTVSVTAAVGLACVVAGCSSGISRFDYPSYSVGESAAPSADPTTTASLPTPSQGVYDQKRYNSYGSSSAARPPSQSTASYSTSKPRYYGTPASAKPSAPPPVAQASGPRIKVQSGDTLSSLSQRYGVPIGTIQSANNLADARLREGQTLIMPGAKMAPKPAPRVAAAPPAPPLVPVAQAPAASSSARKVKTTTIPAPGASAVPGTTQSTTKASPQPASKAPQRVASTAQLPNPDPMSGNSFRWPVKGRIISGFGTKPDGGHNDGINISVPQGTPVKAAENGVVAYAGSELKGYGNLVLIRHANNWVSAYANNEKIMVTRGEKVRRGQVIARAGTSGSVSQPQVHFELRKGSRPVNPTKYMSSMAAQAN
jgi:murein DD-endopeptidase MepM/ murein hydrolase activator NlpD